MIKKFNMEERKEASTPMATSTYLDLDEKAKLVNESKYRGMISSLLYLNVSQPNIMLNVCLCGRYQPNPKEYQLTIVKRIIKCLKGTSNVGLWYPKGTSLSIIGVLDSDFVGCKLDRKSTNGTCHLLGSSLISWNCKKKACVELSTAEAKYIAARSCCTQSL